MEPEEKAAATYIGVTTAVLTSVVVIWGAVTDPAATLRGIEIAGAFVGLIGGVLLWVRGFNWFLDRASRKNEEKSK